MFIFLDLVALFRLSVSSSIDLLVNFIILFFITPEKFFIDILDVNHTIVVCMDPAFYFFLCHSCNWAELDVGVLLYKVFIMSFTERLQSFDFVPTYTNSASGLWFIPTYICCLQLHMYLLVFPTCSVVLSLQFLLPLQCLPCSLAC